MKEDKDPIAAFGSAEEGNEPLKPYIDPALFETLDMQSQVELLTPVFDAITLAGVDYDLKVADSATGKRYTLTKYDEIVETLSMNSNFTDQVLDALEHSKEND